MPCRASQDRWVIMKMGTIKDKDGMDPTEAEDIRRGGKNTQKNCTKKVLMTQITMMLWLATHLEPDILECAVKWASGSITANKGSGGNEFQLSYLKS